MVCFAVLCDDGGDEAVPLCTPGFLPSMNECKSDRLGVGAMGGELDERADPTFASKRDMEEECERDESQLGSNVFWSGGGRLMRMKVGDKQQQSRITKLGNEASTTVLHRC